MFFIERKLEKRIQELSEYRYQEMSGIKQFMSIQDNGEVGLYPPAIGVDHHSISIGDAWEGRDIYVWLQILVEFPELKPDKRIVGRFRFGRTGGGSNSGFESLLFINNKPYQGVDSNHEEVLFDNTLANERVSLDFRMWTGLEGGGAQKVHRYTLDRAEVGYLDEKVDELYYRSLAIHQTILELDENDPNRTALLSILDKTYLEIHWSVPGSDSFYKSCYNALQMLNRLQDHMEKQHLITVNCVGHTHIDVAWLWCLKHTREKVARSFSTVLRLMDEYPDYIFFQSQPQLYKYLKNDYPEIYSRLKERIAEGRWEADGSMWLEADCNIPSGESLVRQILYGKRFLKEEFDVDCSVLWLPDVFGYSWALPQILKKSGIKTFMTTKISWNQYNRMPHDTFLWKGIDGTKILTHFITTPDTGGAADNWLYTYNGMINAKAIIGSWKGYRDKRLNRDILLSFGYGDGGGGVNRDMLEMRRKLDRVPGLPNVKMTTVSDYFNRLHQKIEDTQEYIHVWDGELYLEYHRGTYTSQAQVKRHNRKLELSLRDTEILGVFNSMVNGWSYYPSINQSEVWEIVLRNQFHDIIPGSSIREVYEDAELEYRDAWDKQKDTLSKITSDLVIENEGKYTVFNSSGINEDHFVQIPFDNVNKTEGYFISSNGEIIPSQKNDCGYLLFVDKLQQFSFTEIEFMQDTKTASSNKFIFENNKLSTPYYEIKWSGNGQFEKVFDKEYSKNVLVEELNGNVFQVFEDKPLAHDAWDIDLFYQEKMKEISERRSFEVVENGEVRFVVRIVWAFNLSKITQDIIFYADSRRIDFKTKVDWHERNLLLKVAFPVDVRATVATYDVQYGNLTRPTNWNTSWEMAKFESVGHQWVDISETGYGISLLNDCKYGYDVKDNIMRLTLIKSATHPDTEADQGIHEFSYALHPHPNDWREARVHQEAWKFNAPVLVFNGSTGYKERALLKATSKNIQIDAIKKAEDVDAIILRFHEFEGRRGRIKFDSDFEVASWVEVDLMETIISSEVNNSEIILDVKPYEIKTVLIRLKDK